LGVEEKGLPHAWIGQDVVLCRTGTESWELVILREVGELGLAYEYKTGEVKGQPVFVPWSSVSWMRPPIPEDKGASETEAG
jgi:hypothetical protein